MVPSIRRTSPRVGATPPGNTTSATPSSRSAAIAFGATSNKQRETDLPHRCPALEDADVPGCLARGDGSRETTDAGADDQSGAQHWDKFFNFEVR